jgi:hypothetical protein
MSDFSQMVQKLNAIEANETVDITPSEETATKRKNVTETASLLSKFNAIQESNPYKSVVTEADDTEVEGTMQDRFAKFLKAERATGAEVADMRVAIEEGTAEYEYCDRAFSKMAETINTLEKMVREGGMLESKIAQAGGDPSALNDMREALSQAYEAYETCHMDALGSTPEQMPEE